MTQDFSQGTMTAFGISVEMKPKTFYRDPFHALSIILNCYEEGENLTVEIKESKYEKVDVKDVIEKKNTSRKNNVQIFSRFFLNKLNCSLENLENILTRKWILN
jgi:hypothetical protein